MPLHLGKLYGIELVYDGAYDATLTHSAVADPEDREKIAKIVASSVTAMRFVRASAIKTLVNTASAGVVLTTVRRPTNTSATTR